LLDSLLQEILVNIKICLVVWGASNSREEGGLGGRPRPRKEMLRKSDGQARIRA